MNVMREFVGLITIKFVSEIYKKSLTHLIDEVQLITATPTKEITYTKEKLSPDAEKLLKIY